MLWIKNKVFLKGNIGKSILPFLLVLEKTTCYACSSEKLIAMSIVTEKNISHMV